MPNSLSEIEKDLLIKGWMSHDARWFMAVAKHFGMDAANRLNQSVCREIGRVEMKRYMKTLALSPAKNLEEYLTLMKRALFLYGSGLAEYDIKTLGDESYEMHMKRCFAFENIVRAGIGDRCECGVFARLQGWVDAHGLEHELEPPLGKCMMALGKECRHKITLHFH